jgi:hypothetical protein
MLLPLDVDARPDCPCGAAYPTIAARRSNATQQLVLPGRAVSPAFHPSVRSKAQQRCLTCRVLPSIPPQQGAAAFIETLSASSLAGCDGDEFIAHMLAAGAMSEAELSTGQVRGAARIARRDTGQVRGAARTARRDTGQVRGAARTAWREHCTGHNTSRTGQTRPAGHGVQRTQQHAWRRAWSQLCAAITYTG